MPAIGMPSGSPGTPRVVAVVRRRGAHLGQHAARHAEELAAARRPTRACAMSNSSVRDALVTSVTCDRAAGQPPHAASCRRCRSATRRARRAPRSPATLSSSQRDLGRREVGVEHQAGALRAPRLVPRRLQRAQSGGGAAVLPDDRVARPARPVARSHSTVVSRWLVMPMAASRGARSTPAMAHRPSAPSTERPDLPRDRARPSRAAGSAAANSR